jgi:hypothetical protein
MVEYDDLGGISKDAALILTRCYPGIFPERLKKTTKIIVSIAGGPSLVSNWALSE